ncbi:tetratricopeptide repeat protein [Kutzneria sp. CA-103260]|uniref:tetratricopeptide repeat protein n=1 Tax=Kutzneria sp. CA-103260 TaxID=2802641 RepID=UPI001BAAF780|nr:tetratricopeptide repeat protein [Kutzneria sp. CA-103260]
MTNGDTDPELVHNTVTGGVSGLAVQAGEIHGNVVFHHHENCPAPSVPEAGTVVARLADPPVPGNEVFVGRDAEVSQLLAALAPCTGAEDGADRATSVVVSAVAGMGGVGKSALARHCALTALRWFSGGVFWIDLQGYSDGGLVTAAAVYSPLLRRLGVPADRIPDQTDERAAVYDQVLRDLGAAGRPVLLVLDNASTASQLQGLLPASGGHRVVVTTRDTLALPSARRLALGVLPLEDAITMLDQRLRWHNPEDDRALTDPVGAARLVRACGALPLALLIAAGLLNDEPHLDADTLAGQLDRASTDGFAHGETRLDTVLTASYERVRRRAPDAARLLSLIAHAPGIDVSTESAAVLADTTVDRARALLRVLLQAYLLTATVLDRWRVHDLVRRHAADHARPDDDDNIEAALTRLLDYYCDTTRAADTHVRMLPDDAVSERFVDREEALAWLDTEHPNLVATVQLAAGINCHTHTINLALALNKFLGWRRHLLDLLTVQELALEAAHHVGDPYILADAWNDVGLAQLNLGRISQAISAFQQALCICLELGDNHGREGAVWGHIGLALWHLDQFEEAIAAHQIAGDIFHDLGNRYGEITAWHNLGLALVGTGRFEQAVAVFQRALDACVDDVVVRHDAGMAWGGLGWALIGLGRPEEAVLAHQTARDIFAELGDRHHESTAWHNVGLALLKAGRFGEALTAFQRDLDICRELSDHDGEGVAWGNIGSALMEAGEFDEARASWNRALHTFQGNNDTDGADWILQLLDDLDNRTATPLSL